MATRTVHPVFSDFMSHSFSAAVVTGQQGWTDPPAGSESLIIEAGRGAKVQNPGVTGGRNYFVLPFFDATAAWTATCVADFPAERLNDMQIEMNVTTTLAVGTGKCSIIVKGDNTVDWSVASNSQTGQSGNTSPTIPHRIVLVMKHNGAGALSLSLNGVALGTPIVCNTAIAATTLRFTFGCTDTGDNGFVQLVSITQPTTVTTGGGGVILLAD